ncbi:transcriptional antiterminator NusG [Paenibacillus sp. CF095]|uniref:antiterminator LoaP n=1 Tax=Paenibacillus sp. CF095 TaxID=1881033 RepID=UPI0008808E08|nr:antiterminator LoaP [Paenibacillus sp. CF095]SDD51794.1 transcriptional antiterminator NusG [Paenibacillus sp. CF095]
MDWYVLFVETGKEDVVRSFISKNFDKAEIRAIVPKRKLIERRLGQPYEVCKTMFPGYVLVNAQMNTKIYYELKRIPSCYRLLNRCHSSIHNNEQRSVICNPGETLETYTFSKIEEIEMRLILQLIGESEIIDCSALYIENAKVRVSSGPLKGKEGIIKKIDKRKRRARIALNFMGHEKLLDVGIILLEKLSENENVGPH